MSWVDNSGNDMIAEVRSRDSVNASDLISEVSQLSNRMTRSPRIDRIK